MSSFILLLPNNLLKLALNGYNYLKYYLLSQNLLFESFHTHHFTICTRNPRTKESVLTEGVVCAVASSSPLFSPLSQNGCPSCMGNLSYY